MCLWQHSNNTDKFLNSLTSFKKLVKVQSPPQKDIILSDISHRSLSIGKGKGKVHPCTGTEALYRPYGP